MASAKAEAFTISDSEKVLKDRKDFLANKTTERKDARASEWAKKRDEVEDKKVPEEKASFFQKYFNDEHLNITNMLKCDGIEPTDRLALTEHFDSISISHQRLQKFYNDSVMFLPGYLARIAQQQLASLKEEISQQRNKFLPKKKFTFKSKVKKNDKGVAMETSDGAKMSAVQKYAQTLNKLQQGCEIIGKSDETVTLSPSMINQKDLSLSKLVNCNVYLLGSPSTVHISNVERCKIVIGPVSGSVFVDGCANSEIATGCQQLRVHHTTDTDFYLHVTSRAIIEDTKNVRFAPYNYEYPELQSHFLLAGLDPESNNWDKVDDFNWLAMGTASPNWKVIGPNDRRSNW